MPEKKRKWEIEKDLQLGAIQWLQLNAWCRLDEYERDFVKAAIAALSVGSLTKRQKRFLGELAMYQGYHCRDA